MPGVRESIISNRLHHHFHRARRRVAAATAAASSSSSPVPAPSPAPPPPAPVLLLQTTNKKCLTTAIEAGRLTAAVFTSASKAREWRKLARFEALLHDGDELRALDGDSDDDAAAAATAAAVGRWVRVPDAAALRAAEASLSTVGQQQDLRYVVMDSAGGAEGGPAGAVAAVASADAAASAAAAATTAAAAADPPLPQRRQQGAWKIIPAENLVAFAQQQPWWRRSRARLLATAATAADAAVLLGSLERGTDGVVLVTDDPAEVRAACAALDTRARAASPPLLMMRRRREKGPEEQQQQGRSPSFSPSPSPSPPPPLAKDPTGGRHPVYEEARVTRVEPVGMADRACVDLASALLPGEGLLVGCFARALFLAHSERDESAYIAARPFRVNAGPLAQYVLAQAPGAGGDGAGGGGGRTAYLSELRCGQTVAVAGADGRLAREAVVARVKVEARPVVLVEAETPSDGERHAVLLQNAETVKLVGPAVDGTGGEGGGDEDEESGDGVGAAASRPVPWRAVSVAQLAPGDRVYVLRQPAARHTGLAIDEGVSER